MKTPEQIAQSIADDWTRLDGEHKEDVIEAMIGAIKADRAQHDVSYARSVIDRVGGRAVIWEPADLLSELEQMVSEDAFEDYEPTGEDLAAIVEEAETTSEWRALDEPTEMDYELIRTALHTAIDRFNEKREEN